MSILGPGVKTKAIEGLYWGMVGVRVRLEAPVSSNEFVVGVKVGKLLPGALETTTVLCGSPRALPPLRWWIKVESNSGRTYWCTN